MKHIKKHKNKIIFISLALLFVASMVLSIINLGRPLQKAAAVNCTTINIRITPTPSTSGNVYYDTTSNPMKDINYVMVDLPASIGVVNEIDIFAKRTYDTGEIVMGRASLYSPTTYNYQAASTWQFPWIPNFAQTTLGTAEQMQIRAELIFSDNTRCTTTIVNAYNLRNSEGSYNVFRTDGSPFETPWIGDANTYAQFAARPTVNWYDYYDESITRSYDVSNNAIYDGWSADGAGNIASWNTFAATFYSGADDGVDHTGSIKMGFRFGGDNVIHYHLIPTTVKTVNVPDTTPPTSVALTSSNGNIVSGKITLMVTANDNVGVRRVEFLKNGVVFGTVTASSNTTTYYWDTTTVANGTYDLTAKAYDAASNVGVSNVLKITVQNATTSTTTTTTTNTTAQSTTTPDVNTPSSTSASVDPTTNPTSTVSVEASPTTATIAPVGTTNQETVSIPTDSTSLIQMTPVQVENQTVALSCTEKVLGTERYNAINSGTSRPTSEELEKMKSCFATTNNIIPSVNLSPVKPTEAKRLTADKSIAILDLKNIKITEKSSQSQNSNNAQNVQEPVQQEALKISGKAEPNSTVILYIFSNPLVITVNTDDQGNWEYTLEDPIQPGSHEVYAVVDKGDGVYRRSDPVAFFIPKAEATAANPEGYSLKLGAPVATAQQSRSGLVGYVAGSVTLLLMAMFGLFLFFRSRAGRQSMSRGEPVMETISTNSDSPSGVVASEPPVKTVKPADISTSDEFNDITPENSENSTLVGTIVKPSSQNDGQNSDDDANRMIS